MSTTPLTLQEFYRDYRCTVESLGVTKKPLSHLTDDMVWDAAVKATKEQLKQSITSEIDRHNYVSHDHCVCRQPDGEFVKVKDLLNKLNEQE
jgi:hypothetical protein